MHNMIEVTQLNRPDTSWLYQDKQGHVHRWYSDGEPATHYNILKAYDLPSLVKITDAEGNEEYPSIWHYECKQCGERIIPGRKADDERVYIRGIK